MKDVKIARNIMVYVGKSWIECYYKWYSFRFLSCGCFEGVAALPFISSWMKRCLYPLLMRCVLSALRRLLKKPSVFNNNTLLEKFPQFP